ncbi:MAG: AAA family ATPase [Thermoplasmatales archaeon]|mgnify:CR=1 FL=1|nr:AAA family ATPase [Thermoplasmatales archaeon]
MRRIAIYGKGGIGKSTVSANVTAAMADMGLTVMQVGCDPKSDSTKLLAKGGRKETVLNYLRDNGTVDLDGVITRGYGGSLCVECGGPKPGTGCAGRGIIAAFEALEDHDVIGEHSPDVILYDVLGDVVCGGFAMPIRNGYARDVFIVTSGEMMALYAASNIAEAVDNYAADGYARLGGIILNARDVESEDEIVAKAAAEMGTGVVMRIDRDPIVQECENRGVTVVEGAPDSRQAGLYRKLAERILELSEDSEGGMRGT